MVKTDLGLKEGRWGRALLSSAGCGRQTFRDDPLVSEQHVGILERSTPTAFLKDKVHQASYRSNLSQKVLPANIVSNDN